MITIIAGSRDITEYSVLINSLKWIKDNYNFSPTAIVSGNARGVDSLGEKYALSKGLTLYKYPAEWDLYGKSAGYIRNLQMACNAQALVAIKRYNSKGTTHMINVALEKQLKVFAFNIDKNNTILDRTYYGGEIL